MKKSLLIILLFFSVLPVLGQYGQDSIGLVMGDIRSGEEQAAFKVDYTINPDIKALPVKADGTKDEVKEGTNYTISKGENGKYTFILTDSEGKEHKVEADTMPATIEDKEGNTYEVNEKGEVKPVSKNSDIKLDPATKDTQSKLAALSFKATANTKYALDEYRDVYDKVTEYKDQYKAEGTAITASAKFMLPGASDEIAVYIKENKDNKLIPEKVRFVTGKGKEYSAVYDNQTKGWTLTIVGGQANDGQELYAVQEVSKDKYETLGKLNIFTYAPLNRSVTLVPVNGKMNNLDKQAVQDGLNEIYNKIGITWTVNVLDQLQGTKEPFKYTPKNGSTFNVTGSGLLSIFTDDMKAINEAFKQSGEYQEDGLYLFVIGDKASESGTEGDMPLGSQFGYLFPGASIRTIAHEVGHGAFNLEHPFDRPGRNSFGKGDLAYNLMEYGSGTELVKLQWDQTRAPGHVIGLFQKDKSGMSVADGGLLELQALLDKLGQDGFALLKKCDTKIISTDSPLRHIAIFGNSYKYIAGILEESGQLKLSEITSIPASEIQKTTKLTIDKDLTQFILLKKGDSYIICSVSEKHDYGLCDPSFKVTDQFYEYLKEDITKCAEKNGNKLKLIRQAIREKLDNQFYNEKGVKLCITLKTVQGDEETLLSPGVDKCENAEIFLKIDVNLETDEVKVSIDCSDNYLKEYVGKWQAKARQYEADWGEPVDMEELRLQVIQDLEDVEVAQSFLDNLVQSANALISNKIAGFVEGVQVSQKIAKNVWDEGNINKSTWHSIGEHAEEHILWPGFAQFNPFVGGATDGVIDEVVGIPVAIKGVYGIMTDKEQREAMAAMFTKDGLRQMAESMAQEVVDIAGDNERLAHAGGNTTVKVATMLVPGMQVTKLTKLDKVIDAATEGLDKFRGIKKIKTKIDNLINKSNDLPARKKAMKDFFDEMDPEFVNLVMDLDIENFDAVLKEMAQTWRKFHGEKFMFDNMKNRGDDFVRQIQKFEAVFDDGTNYAADILLKTGKRLEYKSWKKVTFGTLMKGDQFRDQLKNYIKSGNFEYVIDGQKLIKDGVPDPSKFVREQFQEVFKKNNYSIYEELVKEQKDVFVKYGINSKSKFIQEINNVDSDWYKLFKVE
ncbi:hypothetical protein FACS1894169_14770 [Bacteroidia bacterium]|nr:hypothetical protein FACS1894169_14770 [Bacteroidia bacterium]